jgi:phosphohistidine phosphatase
MQKTLILLRHAKAEAGQDDHARPLAERGIKEAHAMGAYMAAHDILPQKTLCSTARRTRETLNSLSLWERVTSASESGEGPHPAAFGVHPLPEGEGIIEFSDAIYNVSENQLLEAVAKTAEEISSLMMIAHNPGLHQLALRLSRAGDDKTLRQLAAEFPPCSLAVIELGNISWREIKSARGKLEMFVTPRMF